MNKLKQVDNELNDEESLRTRMIKQQYLDFQIELGRKLRMFANDKGRKIETCRFEFTIGGHHDLFYATYNFDNHRVTSCGVTKKIAIYKCIVKGADYFFDENEMVEFLTYYTKTNL